MRRFYVFTIFLLLVPLSYAASYEEVSRYEGTVDVFLDPTSGQTGVEDLSGQQASGVFAVWNSDNQGELKLIFGTLKIGEYSFEFEQYPNFSTFGSNSAFLLPYDRVRVSKDGYSKDFAADGVLTKKSEGSLWFGFTLISDFNNLGDQYSIRIELSLSPAESLVDELRFVSPKSGSYSSGIASFDEIVELVGPAQQPTSFEGFEDLELAEGLSLTFQSAYDSSDVVSIDSLVQLQTPEPKYVVEGSSVLSPTRVNKGEPGIYVEKTTFVFSAPVNYFAIGLSEIDHKLTFDLEVNGINLGSLERLDTQEKLVPHLNDSDNSQRNGFIYLEGPLNTVRIINNGYKPFDGLFFDSLFWSPFFESDSDSDGLLDEVDNCPTISNPDQADLDSDNVGDACDTDVDGDSVEDTLDNCPLVANSDQLDVDSDLIGDACDDLIDNDADGIANDLDNCPAVPNADQANNDGDVQGDACDLDDDNDGVEDIVDNCSLTANEDQADNDSDNIGDVCDSDDDNDAIEDDMDNCPLIANVGQDDNDGDGFGDVCDPDDDNDAVDDSADNCPLSFNPDQSNTDGVGAGDACNDAFDVDDDDWENDYDNCPDVANRNQSDFDYDNIGDACDSDVDGDEVANAADACELTPLGELVGSIGCSIEQLCPCDAPRQSTDPWKNHGQYVSCMTKAAQSFADDGVISDNEKSDLVSAAAQSSCGY